MNDSPHPVPQVSKEQFQALAAGVAIGVAAEHLVCSTTDSEPDGMLPMLGLVGGALIAMFGNTKPKERDVVAINQPR